MTDGVDSARAAALDNIMEAVDKMCPGLEELPHELLRGTIMGALQKLELAVMEGCLTAGGHHIDAAGRFQSDKFPELPPDTIRLSFGDKTARLALQRLAQSYRWKDPDLAADINRRLATVEAERPEGAG